LVANSLMPTDGPRLRVELSYGDGPTFGLDLEGESVTIGRAPRNQLSLGHPDVAKVHVRLFRGAGRLWVQAVDRTVRNDEILERIVEARGGDTLQIGPYKVVLKLPSAWVELPELPDESDEDAETVPTEVLAIPRLPEPDSGVASRLRAALQMLLRGRTGS
jgi:pSer/pThr/pTyr-binding forkhead associated (FHA) protein